MLHEFLTEHYDDLVATCRAKASKRERPRPTDRELKYGIPVFLEQLAAMLREETVRAEAERLSGPPLTPAPEIDTGIAETACSHGIELMQHGYSVDQVIHGYGDVCQAVTELAIKTNAPITNTEFRTLNRCLDNAIADAVTEFSRVRDQGVSDESSTTMNERLGFLAHEFRNLVNTAMLALAAIRSGDVGIGGSTGAILERSLKSLQDLCARALVDVRLSAGMPEQRERVLVSAFIEETQVATAIDAKARGIELVVPDVKPDLAIMVDRQILSGALANLLQNAFKFTHTHGKVSLKAYPAGGRVLIDVEDECGGLPPGSAEELFEMFKQGGGDRSGMGLGLGISRRGVEANGGTLRVRNLPGKGCVFTIDLPPAGAAKVGMVGPAGPIGKVARPARSSGRSNPEESAEAS